MIVFIIVKSQQFIVLWNNGDWTAVGTKLNTGYMNFTIKGHVILVLFGMVTFHHKTSPNDIFYGTEVKLYG